MEAIAEFLDERTVSYQLIPLTMEFDNPALRWKKRKNM